FASAAGGVASSGIHMTSTTRHGHRKATTGLRLRPVLGLVGSGEGREPLAQLERFCRGVSGPAFSHIFTEKEGADGHCQSGNLAYSAAVSMDWLDEAFA
ncbi:MAG: hypothetical protein IRY87_22860, partial [Acetobacteraceae bacterium]|nr:hypothetical protein [Acetobacteraceae bacterium]